MGQGQIIGVVLLSFGLICAIFATVLDYWCYIRISNEPGHPKGYAVHFGLWNRCELFHKSGVLAEDCVSWVVYSHTAKISLQWVHTCQALMIFGLVLYGSTFLAALVCLKTNQQTRISAYLSGMGGICCIVAVIVFDYYKDSAIPVPSHSILYAAFGLAISSSCFSFISVYFLWRHTRAAGYQNVDVL